MEVIDVEDQISITIDDDEISDPGSVTEESSARREELGLFSGEELIRIGEGSVEHDLLKRVFLLGMGTAAKDTDVVAIHRNTGSSLAKKARLDSYKIFSEAVARKCGGNANTRYAWYGGARDEILGILKHGFSLCTRPMHGPSYGDGLHLASAKFSIDSASSSVADEDGLRHILLCRVIMGNMEVVYPGSKQFHPSSQNFDSGVDNPSDPRRLIVWSAFMNSYILPAFIITFRAPACLNHFQSVPANVSTSTTPRMSIPALISVLSRSLNPSQMALIEKRHKDLRDLKITRHQFVHILRLIVGDELLAEIVKTHAQAR
ncbi:probable inactive poly [ADP-ribose] polymerase SRO2 [Corylus avellana]|uniref:probable inactive poly [ADP-ribose] polymerase SRO2 n=1 Tax=Corylus avellana TaxID=13451 RepID=UPI00286C4426|nr:probable inactive poly [ADP-ribose] polymerase SRO2 [Corylus avellana]